MQPLANFKTALAARLELARIDSSISVSALDNLVGQLREGNTNTLATSSPNSLDDVFMDACNTAEKKCSTECDLTLVRSLRALGPDMDWFKRPSKSESQFHKGHSNAEIIGRRVLDDRDGITVGLTVLKPGVTYLDHHPPE